MWSQQITLEIKMVIKESGYGVCLSHGRTCYLEENPLFPWLLDSMLSKLDKQVPKKRDCWRSQGKGWSFICFLHPNFCHTFWAYRLRGMRQECRKNVGWLSWKRDVSANVLVSIESFCSLCCYWRLIITIMGFLNYDKR